MNVKMCGVFWAHVLITFFGDERNNLMFAFNCGNISPFKKNIAKYLWNLNEQIIIDFKFNIE